MSSIIQQYQTLQRTAFTEQTNWENVRFVVLDCESTGLDVRKDRLISIGGIVVWRGDIMLEDSFSVLLPVAYNTSSVMVHGITREASKEAGIPEDEAIAAFLQWLGAGIIVGHHISYDISMLNQAMEKHWGQKLWNPVIDTMDLTLRLEDKGSFGGSLGLPGYSLDALCEVFSVVPHDRHTAEGDAFITALIFQKLLRTARAAQFLSLGDLTKPFVAAPENP